MEKPQDIFMLLGDPPLENLLAWLDWQIFMGADEFHADKPLRRFQDAIPMEKKFSREIVPTNVDNTKNDTLSIGDDIPLGSFAANEQAIKQATECKTLDDIIKALQNYEGCELKNMALNLVFGDGVVKNPSLMVIGDAPDAIEDREGKVFAGPAGQLIKKALAAADFFIDKNTYITNSLYWRRPGNRRVNLGEQKICLPFLLRQIALIDPEQIWVMGLGGTMGFFDSTIMKCRGQKNLSLKVMDKIIPVMVGHAPDYYWQNSIEKKSLWQDILQLKKLSKMASG
ncbi:MAG: uracil-DNA glycosylase [Alphaproteobacteria bacterium]